VPRVRSPIKGDLYRGSLLNFWCVRPVIDIIRFNVSEFLHNLGATSEELPFFCENGKSPKGEKLYNIYLFRSFCIGEKSDSEVIKVTVNAKAVRRITIVKSFENGMSVLENRGKFIYT